MPTLHEGVKHLWGWFSEVFHGEVLTYTEIDSWARLTGTHIEPYEVNWLRSMSIEWHKEMTRKDG